jgi:hypothetical protein
MLPAVEPRELLIDVHRDNGTFAAIASAVARRSPSGT